MATPRLILQHDWFDVLSEHGESAWIMSKIPGKPSVDGTLHSQRIDRRQDPVIHCSTNFRVGLFQDRSLQVGYSQNGVLMESLFYAPNQEFRELNASVQCLDTTTGGLGVYSQGTDMKIFDTKTGETRRELKGHLGDVYTCKFFPSGLVVLSGGGDLQLKIWSAEDGSCPATLRGHKQRVQDSAFVSRGRNVVSCSADGTARLWDCGQASCITTVADMTTALNCCSLDAGPAGVDLGQPVNTSDREVDTGGKLLLVGAEDGSVDGFSLACRSRAFHVKCSGAINCITHITQEQFVCGTDLSMVYIFDIRNLAEPLAWLESRSGILAAAPYKEHCVLGAADGSCFIVRIGNKQTIELSGPDCDPVYTVSFDGKFIYTGSRDRVIRKYLVR